MPWGPHSHVFPSWGPLGSLFFILGGFSSPIKSHILSSHGSSGGTERLPAFCGGSRLRENETEATRCGDAEPETRVSIASPAVNHSTSKGHPTLEGRGHGLPLRAEGESHVSKGREDRPGFGRPSLRTRFQRTPNLCTRDDTKHPWGGGGGRQGPADAIGFFQRQAASQPAAGLKATPPLQLFNELGTLWFPSAKPDNTKARVSQTRPPPFQRSLSPKRKRACFQRDRTMSSPLWRTVRTLKAGSTRVAG